MPYTGAGDPSLPKEVQALPEDKKAQWVGVFNSAYADCNDSGGTDCDKVAFAQAWGVVNQPVEAAEAPPAEEAPPSAEEAPAEDTSGLATKLGDFLKMLEKGLKDLLGIKEEAPAEGEPPAEPPAKEQSKYLPFLEERSVSMPAIYDQAYLQVQGQDQLAMMYDIYLDDDGMFAIVASGGKLFKLTVTVKDGTVALGKWEEIAVNQNREASFKILRTTEGRYRWVSVSATAVLNRSGEIDSRQLFDNIIKRAEATGNYPIRVFFHAGAKFRTGQCDFLGRDENVLVTSGLYDQTELAMREVKARLEEPDFWGDSISFYPMSPAQKVRANNVEIPVYTDGILEEISTLPEKDAASWLTATPTIMEVNRMLNQRQMNAFIKLFGDEEEAKKWLEVNAAQRNKTILESGMITRAKRELTEIIQKSGEAPQEVTAPEIPAETPPPPADTTEQDEAMLDAIAQRVVSRMDIAGAVTPVLTDAINNAVNPLITRVEALEKRFETETDQTTKSISQALQRLSKLDKTEEQKRREWTADLPVKPDLNVTHRPRETRDTDREVSAEKTLSRIPVKY